VILIHLKVLSWQFSGVINENHEHLSHDSW